MIGRVDVAHPIWGEDAFQVCSLHYLPEVPSETELQGPTKWPSRCHSHPFCLSSLPDSLCCFPAHVPRIHLLNKLLEFGSLSQGQLLGGSQGQKYAWLCPYQAGHAWEELETNRVWEKYLALQGTRGDLVICLLSPISPNLFVELGPLSVSDSDQYDLQFCLLWGGAGRQGSRRVGIFPSDSHLILLLPS